MKHYKGILAIVLFWAAIATIIWWPLVYIWGALIGVAAGFSFLVYAMVEDLNGTF